MLRSLLAERFGIVSHNSTQEFPIYALATVKGSMRLPPVRPDEPSGASPSQGGVLRRNTGMANFAEWLSGILYLTFRNCGHSAFK